MHPQTGNLLPKVPLESVRAPPTVGQLNGRATYSATGTSLVREVLFGVPS